MEREYYIIPDYAALKHLLQQKSVGTYQYRYKRFVMVLERNHQFLSPQISWIVDINSVCFILIRGSLVITQIDDRLDHRCLLPPLSPTSVLSAFLARCRRRQRPAHGSTRWRRPAHDSSPAVAAACAQLFPGGGGALPQPAIRARLFPATRPARVPPSIHVHGSSQIHPRRPSRAGQEPCCRNHL